MGVAVGNIQQISYIPQMEQHLPFELMLLRLGNVTIMCYLDNTSENMSNIHVVV